MLFSYNKAGRCQAYSDQGIFLGYIDDNASQKSNVSVQDGGAGSGNFGHKGRAGKRGGSAKRGEGGGAQHLKKQSMSAAKSADNEKFKKVAQRALHRLPKGTILCSGKQDDGGWSFRKSQDGLWRLADSDEGLTDEQMTRTLRYDDEGTYLRAATAVQQEEWNHDNAVWKSAMSKIDRVKKIRQAAKDWKSKVPQQIIDSMGGLSRRMLANYQPSEALHKGVVHQNDYFKAMGMALGWDKVCEQGKFDLLSKSQKDTLELIRSRAFDMARQKYGVQGQDGFLQRCSGTIRDLYDSLKAKALGVDITPPAVDASLVINYLRQNPDYKPFKQLPQQRGYVSSKGSQETMDFVEGLKKSKVFQSIPKQHKAYVDAIAEKVSQIDQDIRPFVQKCFDNVYISWNQHRENSSGGGNCCYTQGSGVITMSRCFADGYQRTPQQFADTFWHQFGHYYDDMAKRQQKIPIISLSSQIISSLSRARECASHNGAYNKAANDDVKNLLKLIGHQDMTILHNDGSSYGGVSVSDNGHFWVNQGRAIQLGNELHRYMMNEFVTQPGVKWMYTQGYPEQVPWGDYYQLYTTPKRRTVKKKWKFPGAQQAYIQAQIKRDEQVQKFQAQHPGFHDQVRKHVQLKQRQQKEVQQLCDMIGQMTLGTIHPVLWGSHSAQYYRSKNSPVQTTAQVFNMLAMGKKNSLECMKKLLPNTYRLMINSIKFKGVK